MASEVEKITTSSADVVTVPEWGALTPAEFAKALKNKDTSIMVSDEEIQQQMMARIANATSIEDLLKQTETIKARDVLGRVMTVNHFHLNNSDPKYGEGVYGVLDVILDGKAETVICGGEKVLMQLYKMQYEGWLPADLRIEQSTEKSANGFNWLYLELGARDEEPF